MQVFYNSNVYLVQNFIPLILAITLILSDGEKMKGKKLVADSVTDNNYVHDSPSEQSNISIYSQSAVHNI